METRELSGAERRVLTEALMAMEAKLMVAMSDAADDGDINRVKLLIQDYEARASLGVALAHPCKIRIVA